LKTEHSHMNRIVFLTLVLLACATAQSSQPYSLQGEWRQRSGGENGAAWNTYNYGIGQRDILLIFDGTTRGSYRFRGNRGTSCGIGVDSLESGTFEVRQGGSVTLNPEVRQAGCRPQRTYGFRLDPDVLDPNVLVLTLSNSLGPVVFSREMSAEERKWIVPGQCTFQSSSYANSKECGGFSVDSDGVYLSLRDRQGQRTEEGGPGVDPHYRISDIPAGNWITPLNFARRPLPLAIRRSGNVFELRVGDSEVQSARMTACEPVTNCRTRILSQSGSASAPAAADSAIGPRQFVGVWQPRGSRASLELRGNGSLVFRSPSGEESRGDWSFNGSSLQINAGAPCPVVAVGPEVDGRFVMRIVCQGNEQIWYRIAASR
jgi:hypothetical protein